MTHDVHSLPQPEHIQNYLRPNAKRTEIEKFCYNWKANINFQKIVSIIHKLANFQLFLKLTSLIKNWTFFPWSFKCWLFSACFGNICGGSKCLFPTLDPKKFSYSTHSLFIIHQGIQSKRTFMRTRPDVYQSRPIHKLAEHHTSKSAQLTHRLVNKIKAFCCLPNEVCECYSTMSGRHPAYSSLYFSTKSFKEVCMLTTIEKQKVGSF